MRVWVAAGIFLGVFIIAFVIFALRTSEGPVAASVPVPTAAAITDITLSDTYSSKSGTHTIHGTAMVPTACTTLLATSTLSGASVRVDLSAPLDTGLCLDLPTAQPYSLTVEAPSDTPIAIYANGELATTTP